MSIRKIQALKARKGFTLVELIVVIAIIAILTAILIPLLVNHVRTSRCTNTISEVKSGYSVAASYASERLARNDTIAEILALTESTIPGVPQGVAITIRDGGEGNIVVTASAREHEYSSSTGTKGCNWRRCPGGVAT
jgi:prepilin-type N-terminal cleavage/methylation domain-containing protein